MWNKIKRISWIAFDEYAHFIAAFFYICTVLCEYFMMTFDLTQLVIYGGVPPIIFSMFHIQGIKKGAKEVEKVIDFMRGHENNIKNIISNIKDMADDEKEIH